MNLRPPRGKVGGPAGYKMEGKEMISNDHRHSQGQSLIELALILALIAAIAIGVLRLMGVRLVDVYCSVVTGIGVESSLCTAESGPLFQDDFSGNLDDWDLFRGNHWRQEDGQLCARNGDHRGLVADSQASDSTISTNAILYRGQGYGIYFRASFDERDKLQGYIFQYDPGAGGGQFVFREYINGAERQPFASSAPPPGFQWTGVTRHIEVVTSGSTFTAKVDGQVVLTGEDDSYTSGQAGLRTWANSDACFDDFTVTVP